MPSAPALADIRTFGTGPNELHHPVDVLGRARFRGALERSSVYVTRSQDTSAAIPFGGTSILFNRRTWIGSRDLGFWEQIAPQSITKTAQEADVRFLQNHNPDLLLARTNPAMRAAGTSTLTLTPQAEGLAVAADMAPVSYAQDLAILLERGDISQMSFAFEPITWVREALDDGSMLITITELRLYDVSVVTYPAYEETDAGLRAAAFDAMCRQSNLNPSAVLRGYLSGGHMPDGQLVTPASTRQHEIIAPARAERAGLVRSMRLQERSLNGWTFADAMTVLDDAVDDLCEQMDARCWGYVYDVSDTWLVFVCVCNGEWCFMQCDYAIDASGGITLGAPVEVLMKTTYVAAPAEPGEPAGDVVAVIDDMASDAQELSATTPTALRHLDMRTAEFASTFEAG